MRKNDIKPPFLGQLNQIGRDIVLYRNRPLVIMYYCDSYGSMYKMDVNALYDTLSKRITGKIQELDVLLHTTGGNPNTAYLLIQTLRKFANKINFLVPLHAYSGGTLMVLGADNIIMGPYASLGPIDIQAYGGAIPILNIEKYVEFVKFAQEQIVNSSVSVSLLLELTKEIKPSILGELFRLRKLTEYYARILLSDYMFKNSDQRKFIVDRIINRLNTENPDHSFDIDYHIANGIGLNVELMDDLLFKFCEKLIYLCDSSKHGGEICKFLQRDLCEDKEQDFRLPFFEVYPFKKGDSNG